MIKMKNRMIILIKNINKKRLIIKLKITMMMMMMMMKKKKKRMKMVMISEIKIMRQWW